MEGCIFLDTYDIQPRPSSTVITASTFAVQHNKNCGRNTKETST
jgi:hypothetical protein